MSDSENNLSKIIRQLFYLLFFLTPLLLWPYTSEVFEFNKMMFVYLITILIASTWEIKSFINKKFEIAKTPLDIPILLFLASQIISTIISINPHTSLWGYYSRFHGGLMSTISYIILYYALVTHFTGHIKSIRNLIIAILSSATLISVYGVLEHFGFFVVCGTLGMGFTQSCWIQDVQNRVFSTLGQPNWLSAFLVALLPLSLFQISSSEKINHRFLHIALSLLFLITIIFTKSQSGITATAIVLFLYFIITAIQKKKSFLLLLLIPFFVLIFIFKGNTVRHTLSSINNINPFYSDTLTIVQEENKTRIGGSDSMIIRRVVWEGAIKLGLAHPLFGTGVETFGYSYYWVRPAAHNLTSEADFLYNKAHNEYLNFLATTGFVGLTVYLFLIGSILYLFLNKKTKHNHLRLPLLLGFLSILITNYIGFSVVNIALFFFLYPAIYISIIEKNSLFSRKLNLDTTIGTLFVSFIAIWTIVGIFRSWSADIAYNKGKTSFEEAEKAVKLNPKEPIYYAQLGNIYSLITTQMIVPQITKLPATASAEIKTQAQTVLEKYINLSVENINKGQTLNPYNLNILKTKAKTELTLATANQKYYQEALNTLLKITELSPTESNNYLNVGILYQNLGKTDLAKLAFEKAVELKPDFQLAKEYLNKL
ncbi:MAG TPA: O-antigen ligase family protein [Spirochaetia bacterium]|nr:O-antigen ligase family protein [Spirochaetia bacterium]